MRPINLDELKKIELQLLQMVDVICRKENFNYSLCGGTMLGAVRHKGFIPWDDDIDILLPRPDYNRFIEYCRNNKVPFDLICNETNSGYGYLFAKVCAKNTRICEEVVNRNNIDMGVYIDIFPLDGLGNTYKEALKNFKSTSFKRELLVAANWKKYTRSKTRPLYIEPIRLGMFILSRFVSMNKLIKSINKKLNSISYENSEYVAVVMGSYLKKEILKKDSYAKLGEITFEGCEFKCTVNYDMVLSQIYGNYMELPPENKRCTHHSFTAYYLD